MFVASKHTNTNVYVLRWKPYNNIRLINFILLHILRTIFLNILFNISLVNNNYIFIYEHE